MKSEAIEAAFQWWADKLRSCKQSGLSAEERIDPRNDAYQMAEMLMTISKPKVTDEQITKFSESLTAKLADGKIRYLGVDYGPDMILRSALAESGISAEMGTLPIKTSMWLDADKVSVRYGYGAPEETIFPMAVQG